MRAHISTLLGPLCLRDGEQGIVSRMQKGSQCVDHARLSAEPPSGCCLDTPALLDTLRIHLHGAGVRVHWIRSRRVPAQAWASLLVFQTPHLTPQVGRVSLPLSLRAFAPPLAVCPCRGGSVP